MFVTHAKKWGNSVGLVIPKRVVIEHRIKQREEIVVEIKKKRIPVLRELFGAVHFSKAAHTVVNDARKELESKFL